MSGPDIRDNGDNGMGNDGSISPVLKETRPPAVLQVVPSLVSGGGERGTVELASALAAAGRRPDGTPALSRWRPAYSVAPRLEKPARDPPQHQGADRTRPPLQDRYRACAQPRPRLERLVGGACHPPPLRDTVSNCF